MTSCKTCKYWTAMAPYGRNEDYEHRQCDSQKLTEGFFGVTADMLVYPYPEGGVFYTGPEFGCVHHSEAQCQDQSQQKS